MPLNHKPDLKIKEDWSDIGYCLEVVKRNGHALQFVENQTEKICLEAIKEGGITLAYVKNQTEKVCIKAVKEDGLALQFVKNQTEKIIQEALKQNPYSVNFIDTSVLPISSWDVKWFKYILKVEFKQEFIKEYKRRNISDVCC